MPHVLIVDDDEAIGAFLGRLLESKGWRVSIAKDAAAALALVAGNNFDVALLDKNLPDMTGLDLVPHVRKSLPEVEIIIMTAHADTRSLLQAIGSGVYDYLVKPFSSLDEVSHTLKRALEKRQMARENRQLIADLEEANGRLTRMNEDLEKMVAERTRQLEQLSLTDDVTGLYNQRFLHSRLDEEYYRSMRYQRSLSVVMLDVDNFKNVNDSHDHLFGSRVLNRVGELLSAGIRDVDMAVRYGGDEFVLILPETCAEGAPAAAERLRGEIERAEVGDNDSAYQVTVSMGVASVDDCEVSSAQGLLQAADRALYAAKKNGRNCVYKMTGKEVLRVTTP